MAVPSPSPSKSALRAEGISRRREFARGLTTRDRAELEAGLARRVLPHLADARVIGAYHPLRDEIGPDAILAGLAKEQRTAFPWFADRDSPLLWRAAPAVEPSPWGMSQPAPDAETLTPDLLLVPVVLADRRGTRIGHGKGHYDRALARLRAAGPVRAIGLAWDAQLLDGPIPADEWDVRLDAVATPSAWIPCG